MAIELLISPEPIFHKPRHDLESIFFVFIYLCTNLSGPGSTRSLQELRELESLPIAAWFNPAYSLERLGADKISALMLMSQRILPYFSPYFNDLKNCATKLFHAIFPDTMSLLHPPNIRHNDIIQIFDDTLAELPIDEPRTSTPQQKCSLGMHDDALVVFMGIPAP